MSITRRIVGTIVAAMLVVALASLDSARAQAPAPFDHAWLAREALEKHIVPGYAALAAAAGGMAKSLDGYCARQPAAQRDMERAFDGLITAWGRIEHIRFGPITQENRLERMFFWPDRRGIGGRQIAQTIQSRDQDALVPAKLASKRVAIQGLAALETALFDAPSKDAEEMAYRCAYAKAIAKNIENLAVTVAKEWIEPDGFSRFWLNPGEGNPHFLKTSETTLALAKALDNGLERVRDEWIAPAVGLGAQRRRLTPVLSTSQRTLRYFLAGLEGLQSLYTKGGLNKAIVDTAKNYPDVTVPLNAKLVQSEIDTARGEITALVRQGKPFDPVAMLRPLVAVGFPLKNAREQFIALMGLTAGLSMGFNASDGD